MVREIPKTLDESLEKARKAYAESDREHRRKRMGFLAILFLGAAYLWIYFDVFEIDGACIRLIDQRPDFFSERFCGPGLAVGIVAVALFVYAILFETLYRIINVFRV